jgi:hypothetical protein
MTETAPAYLPAPDDVSDQIIDFTLALQDYLANDPDLRATDLLATAVDIMDALLAGEDRVLF